MAVLAVMHEHLIPKEGEGKNDAFLFILRKLKFPAPLIFSKHKVCVHLRDNSNKQRKVEFISCNAERSQSSAKKPFTSEDRALKPSEIRKQIQTFFLQNQRPSECFFGGSTSVLMTSFIFII